MKYTAIPRFITLATQTAPFVVAILFVTTDAKAQALTNTEQRIVAEVATQADKAIALLERSVNINSGTMNFDGVHEVSQLYTGAFEATGIDAD